MARRTRRFKRRQIWLPVLGNNARLDEGVVIAGSATLGENALLTSNSTDGIVWEAFPITYDQGPNPEFAWPVLEPNPYTLRDRVAGNEWSLRRVVGKVFIANVASDGSIDAGTRPQAVEAGFGLIVCNTDDDGSPLTNFNEVNPLSAVSAEDPWIFHRVWLLGNVAPNQYTTNDTATATAYDGMSRIPMTNIEYGSVMDGPHIDQKTARRIHRSERLYGVYAQRVISDLLNETIVNSQNVTTVCKARLRLLGNIRSAVGNRGNASR